jgi:hypothetical protein
MIRVKFAAVVELPCRGDAPVIPNDRRDFSPVNRLTRSARYASAKGEFSPHAVNSGEDVPRVFLAGVSGATGFVGVATLHPRCGAK